jgi:hypothetical protein
VASGHPLGQALSSGLPASTRHRPLAASLAALVALLIVGLALLATVRQRPG